MHLSPIAIFFLPLLAQAKPVKSKTNEIFYLSNCFVSLYGTSWAEIDYYKNAKIGATASKPDLVERIGSKDVSYEDGTVHTLPGADAAFNFTAMIGPDAYTAAEGSVVGKANSSTYKGTLECLRITRVMLYAPGKESNCYSDYACVDVSCGFLFGMGKC